MSSRPYIPDLPQNINAFYCYTCVRTVKINPPNRTCPHCKLGFIDSIGPSDTKDFVNMSPPNLRRFLEKYSNIYQRNTNIQRRNVRFIDETLPRYLNAIIGYIDGTDLFGFIAGHMSYEVGKQNLELRLSFIIDQIEHDPLPLTADEMNNLQKEAILNEEVEANLHCAVCLENFNLEEIVRKLNCNHYFHEHCIFSWVKLHATCPICRKYLNAEQNTEIFPTAESMMVTLKGIAESRELLRNLKSRCQMPKQGTTLDNNSYSTQSRNLILMAPTRQVGAPVQYVTDSSSEDIERSETSAAPDLGLNLISDEESDLDSDSTGSKEVPITPVQSETDSSPDDIERSETSAVPDFVLNLISDEESDQDYDSTGSKEVPITPVQSETDCRADDIERSETSAVPDLVLNLVSDEESDLDSVFIGSKEVLITPVQTETDSSPDDIERSETFEHPALGLNLIPDEENQLESERCTIISSEGNLTTPRLDEEIIVIDCRRRLAIDSDSDSNSFVRISVSSTPPCLSQFQYLDNETP